MPRTNPPKLSVKFPVVKFIKNRMKKDDEFTDDHVKGFDRRVRDHKLMMFMIEYCQELYDKAKKRELDDEEKRLTDTCRYQKETIKNQQEEIDRLKEKIEELESQLEVYRCYD